MLNTNSQILIFKFDIAKYPPILTIIDALLTTSVDIIYIGGCSDDNLRAKIEAKGVRTFIINSSISSNAFTKFIDSLSFVHKVNNIVRSTSDKNSQLWLFGIETIWLLNKLVSKKNTVLYLFETPLFSVPITYRFFCSNKTYYHLMKSSSSKVVCCEYNRAHVTKAFFGLSYLPHIIPNKPLYVPENLEPSSLLERFSSKKILLYQGVFNYPERQLEGFCQAMDLLPDDFILVLMGGPENNYKKQLQSKYESSRIIFLPFLTPPHHLSVTKMAYIGILTYFPSCLNSISPALNVLYCAPNKIFEYSYFGIPMISNDLPALHHSFSEYGAGICVEDSMCSSSIANAILEMDKNYDSYKHNSLCLYKSVDVKHLILNLV